MRDTQECTTAVQARVTFPAPMCPRLRCCLASFEWVTPRPQTFGRFDAYRVRQQASAFVSRLGTAVRTWPLALDFTGKSWQGERAGDEWSRDWAGNGSVTHQLSCVPYPDRPDLHSPVACRLCRLQSSKQSEQCSTCAQAGLTGTCWVRGMQQPVGWQCAAEDSERRTSQVGARVNVPAH